MPSFPTPLMQSSFYFSQKLGLYWEISRPMSYEFGSDEL
jgi:hypothetical protein